MYLHESQTHGFIISDMRNGKMCACVCLDKEMLRDNDRESEQNNQMAKIN